MPNEKLFQDQILILAGTREQGVAAERRVRRSPEEYTSVVLTDNHPLTVVASIAGRHVKAVYQTEDAMEGKSWHEAEVAARKCMVNSGRPADEQFTRLW